MKSVLKVCKYFSSKILTLSLFISGIIYFTGLGFVIQSLKKLISSVFKNPKFARFKSFADRWSLSRLAKIIIRKIVKKVLQSNW